MMAIEAQLNDLVMEYTHIDADKKIYERQLNPDEAATLEYGFIKLVKNQLSISGPYPEHLRRNYRPLSLYLHPDHMKNFSPELLWIEQQLSGGVNNGSCFVLLGKIYQELISQHNFLDTFLKELIINYSEFDADKKYYMSVLDDEGLLRLEKEFEIKIKQFLLIDGPQEEKITARYQQLVLYFDPKYRDRFLPEIVWIENSLSRGQNDGVACKSIQFYFDQLVNPQKYTKITFKNIHTEEDFRQWLDNLKKQSNTYSMQKFYTSLLNLLEQSSQFFDDAGQIKPTGLRVLVKSIPILFAGFGAIILAEEIFAIYALYFVLLKGGQYLDRSSFLELRQIGKALQGLSFISATATTTLMVSLLEMTFWASRQCLGVSLQIGSSIFSSLILSPSITREEQQDTEQSIFNDLILAGKNQIEGIEFKNPELKVISAPLESYLAINKDQIAVSLRAGGVKALVVQEFLTKMRAIDQEDNSMENKISQAQAALDAIKIQAYVYNSKTAIAVDRAYKIIELLRVNDQSLLSGPSSSQSQLLEYTSRM